MSKHMAINKIKCVYLHSGYIVPINYLRTLLETNVLLISVVTLN